MTTEERLWWRFKEIQDKINSLSSIVQNPLESHQFPAEELATWINEANNASSQLGKLILDTYSFLEGDNAKDI